MIVRYNDNKYFLSLLSFVSEYKNNDFFYTKDNERKIIEDDDSLKAILKEAKLIYVDEVEDDINGIVLTWESLGGNIKRQYVKYLVKTPIILNNLLLHLTQNSNEEFYVKIKKDTPYLLAFKNNGFVFKNGRGKEILLVKGNLNDPKRREVRQNFS